MPLELPVASLLLVGVLIYALFLLPQRARGEDIPPGVVQPTMVPEVIPPVDSARITPTTEPVLARLEPEPTPEEAVLETLPEGDPLDDPLVGTSPLESSQQVNILLLGTDGRDEEDGPPRTDLMMLALLDLRSHRATIISIPRDLWVPIPGYGEGKINTAFFLGSLDQQGAELARETVEDLAGLSIHHTVQVDFHGFRTLIDQMDGIEVNVPEAIDDPMYPDEYYGTFHLHIPAGRQIMDGERALQYARTRYGGMDQDRSARQQAVVMAIRERAMQPAQLARAPLHLRAIYRTIESDLSLADLFALARFGRSLDRDHISMHTLNGELTWSVITWNGQDALLYDPQALRATIRDWMRGVE
jgi:polyisoprenyl-teichoic acid--peptidoglycan teichoic acid transferase